jgi:hypothetical protein
MDGQLLFGIPGGLGFVGDDLKQRAHAAVQKAIADGTMVRPGHCEECGNGPSNDRGILAHHDDYNKPLAVRWLCTGCHGRVHRFDTLPPKKRKRGKRIALTLSEHELAHVRAFADAHWSTSTCATATMCRIALLYATAYEPPDDE